MRANRSRPSVKGSSSRYDRFTPTLAFQLAAPQTWAAALTPVLLSYVYCGITYSGKLNILYALMLLCVSIATQSAANVLNDYADYKKGTDSLENSSEDAFDAVLVYNNLNPRSVLGFGVALLVVAVGLGVYLASQTSWLLLVIGVIGALTIVFYSGGRTPISYLPIGEVVIGFVMGGLIPLACCYALSGILEPLVLIVALPCMFGIGMILFTNNTCDIEKDIPAQRRTASVVLGRARAVRTYRSMVIVWILICVAIVGIFYGPGMPFILLMVLALFPTLRALLANPLVQGSRDGAMAQITTLNVAIIAFYCIALASSAIITWV